MYMLLFSSGGIEQTVIGQYLDSVSQPYMTVTLLYQFDKVYNQSTSVSIYTYSICHSVFDLVRGRGVAIMGIV